MGVPYRPSLPFAYVNAYGRETHASNQAADTFLDGRIFLFWLTACKLPAIWVYFY